MQLLLFIYMKFSAIQLSVRRYDFFWMRRASFANCSEHSALEKNYGKKMKYVGSNVNIATDGKGGMV